MVEGGIYSIPDNPAPTFLPIRGDAVDAMLGDLFTFALRPYDFVLWAFPWGEPGSLVEYYAGPEGWQVEALRALQTRLLAGPIADDTANRYIGEAVKMAIKSGHNVGKTSFLSWVSWWALATRENTRGRATANTEKQLRTILWSELAKWHSMFIAGDLFEWTATSIYRKGAAGPNWRMDAIPWSEHNLDAFSGLHNLGGRVFVLFDEASGIHEGIWERVGGVMNEANTEKLWIATSNPSRNHGRFYECFNRFADDWIPISVDSRDVPFTDHAAIEREIAAWGVDSDYIKVRWLGVFPDAGSTQLIPLETIRAARTRIPVSYHYEPLILGVDVARFGTNESVLTYRRGKDARTIPTERYRGLSTTELGDKAVAQAIQHQCDGILVDEGGVGGGVVDFIRRLGHACIGVNFGGKPGTHPNGIPVYNKRAEMYVALREWLREGGCVEDSEDLEKQLLSIEYFFRAGKREIQLIPKEDMQDNGFDSPDVADALAITFAYPVSRKNWGRAVQVSATHEYEPYSQEAMYA
jgi:hypothetical protein